MRYIKLPSLAGLLAGSSISASELYVFPAKGQSDAQKDKYSCYQWARKNTAYDPVNPPRVSTTTASAEPYRPGGNRRKFVSEVPNSTAAQLEIGGLPKGFLHVYSPTFVSQLWHT